MENVLVFAIVFLIVMFVAFVATKIEGYMANKKRVNAGNHNIIQGKAVLSKFLLVAAIIGIGAIIGLLTYTQGWLN